MEIRPIAEVIVDYENAKKYLRIVSKFVNSVFAKSFRIVRRLVFNVRHVYIPGFVTILTSTYYERKVYGNKLVDREIIRYLREEFKGNVLILVAADNDYAQVLQELKSRGVYIIVVGHAIAKKLLEVADEYYLVDMDAIPEPVVIPVKQ